MNLFSLVHQFNNVNSDNHAVIQETSVNSDIVMVTNSFNSTTSKGSFSSTSPMKLQIASDKLILLHEENKNDDFEISDELTTHLDATCQSSKITNLKKMEEYRTVKLVKEKSIGFGLSIKGGCEHGLPILISGLTKDGPADRSRQLFIGDAIVRIDDSVLTLTHTTHEEAIRLLKQAGVEVSLTVKHFKMVSPFLTKCWKKKQTLDEAGDLMVTSNNNVDLMVDEKLLTIVTKKEIICDSNFKSGPGKLEPQSCEGKIKKSKALSSKAVSSEKQKNVKNWIPLISIDLATCFVTKYVHDSDKIRPHGFEIRWLTAVDSQSKPIKSYPSTAFSSSSSGSASSSTSSTTSLSTPKSVDSGVGVGIKCASNSTITSVENPKEPLVVTKTYSSAIVICDNQEIYRKWFFNIDKSVKTVIHNRVKLLNSYLPGSEKIHFMGWISQGLPTTSSEPYRPCYHWYTRYLVLKGGDGLIYKKPPNGLLCHPTNDNSSLPCIRWSEGEPYLFKAHQLKLINQYYVVSNQVNM
uniref:PDZ domain-containing protein n=1 Tax=Tetranychus urticae TaxID=32264 RepID=T1KRX9_TETUR